MENPGNQDKGRDTFGYLRLHLHNLILMCRENSKVVTMVTAFAVLAALSLFVGTVAEAQPIETVVIPSQEEESSVSDSVTITVMEEALEKDAYPEVNNLIKLYYQALVEGDMESLRGLKEVTETEEIKILEKSKYIESYPAFTVYTKKGYEEGAFIAYVHYEVKFVNYEALVPGINPFYICPKEDGSYYIAEEADQETEEYIKMVTAHNDVIDLFNTVQVSYNELLASDEDLSAFLAELEEKLKVSASLALAELEEENSAVEAEEAAEEAESMEVVIKVKTTDVVNVRSSDSIEADRIGQATAGQVLPLLEEKLNGWSKVEFEDTEGYIKSEYLIPEETMTVSLDGEEIAGSEEGDGEEASQGKLTDTVNVRKTASIEGEKLGQLYQGSTVEILEQLSSGWTKIRYNDGEAYVKSDYVE